MKSGSYDAANVPIPEKFPDLNPENKIQKQNKYDKKSMNSRDTKKYSKQLKS
jgi:hypothetical protein